MNGEFLYYPLNDYGPVMKGLTIGGLGIFHVFTAQFAIGGGFLMCYFQWLAQSGKLPVARKFLDSYFKFLVLISFVIGAITGVAMWFTSIQVSPRTIGVMIDEFHWLWATEWTFFCLEVIAGYAFYRYGKRLADRTRMTLLVLYTVAAWMSLFWINGILAWQLTPGGWSETHSVLYGFFNPSFWPSLFYRTIAAWTIAALVGMVVINAMHGLSLDDKKALINRAAYLLGPMVLMPIFGGWFLAVMPEDSRSYVTGVSVAMTMFMQIAVLFSFLIGGYAVLGLIKQKLYINGATATLLCLLAFVASGAGEFVREGVRKPFTVREYLYSNSITKDQVATMREKGCVTDDFYPLLNEASYIVDNQVRLGAKVYRMQCSVCHTVDGVNGLTHLTKTWTTDQKRMNIAKLQRTKSFMPPFSGTPEELEALVQMLEWVNDGKPMSDWSGSAVTMSDDELQTLFGQLKAWMNEAGTEPGYLSELDDMGLEDGSTFAVAEMK